jgi:hypothetical protein
MQPFIKVSDLPNASLTFTDAAPNHHRSKQANPHVTSLSNPYPYHTSLDLTTTPSNTYQASFAEGQATCLLLLPGLGTFCAIQTQPTGHDFQIYDTFVVKEKQIPESEITSQDGLLRGKILHPSAPTSNC